MKVTYPIRAVNGNEYLVRIESFNREMLPDDVKELLGSIEILDISLERVSGNTPTSPNVLFDISNFIAGVLNDNPETILYFYCDDIHDVDRRNRSITPQKYRSQLFSSMFDRYTQSHDISDIINTPLEFKIDRDVYIHFISKREYLKYVDAFKDTILGGCK